MRDRIMILKKLFYKFNNIEMTIKTGSIIENSFGKYLLKNTL